MQHFKYLVVVLLLVGTSNANRRAGSGGYRCPDNVSEEECNNYQCPKNAELVECINFCNTCEQATVCIDYCAPGCDCKAGFLRDASGACVPKSSCKKAAPAVDSEEADDGGCPFNQLCRASCRRSGRKGGRCTGPRSRRCECS